MNDIYIKKWVKRGSMLVNTEALELDDPDHVYNQIIQQGGKPEDYYYKYPFQDKYKDLSRFELEKLCYELEKENIKLLKALG